MGQLQSLILRYEAEQLTQHLHLLLCIMSFMIFNPAAITCQHKRRHVAQVCAESAMLQADDQSAEQGRAEWQQGLEPECAQLGPFELFLQLR
jgi:hypothetical protein